MKQKRIGILWLIGTACLFFLVGCSRREALDDTEKISGSKTYQQGSMPVLKNEKGYYYYSVTESGFRYIDAETGKELFLCNKPECKHDGDAFCVATNDKYTIGDYCLYNNRIYVNAVEDTETQYVYKILAIEIDGSGLNEVCTYLTLEKTEQSSFFDKSGSGFVVHKGKALVPFCVRGQGNLNDTTYYGAAVLNLETGEVTYLDEEPLSKENGKITNLSACGEYFYYCEKEARNKKALHRYHLTEKADERMELFTDFTGKYVVLDDNTIIYQKQQGAWLCRYDNETRENEKKVELKWEEIIAYNGTEPVKNINTFTPEQMKTDGENIYITETIVRPNGEGNYTRYLHIYNDALEEKAMFDYLGELEKAEFEGHEDITFFYGDLWWIGENVICVAYQKENADDRYVFHCKKNELLMGTPGFQFIYMYSLNDRT